MWTMEELVDRVRAALAAQYSGAPNGRVRDLPDRRAIRWYSTIGLVDRPLGMRGRNALYGPRHLLQLVAIKRLQAAGRTLAEVQAELAGAGEQTLVEVARVPADLLSTGPAPPAEEPRGAFWKAAPVPPTDWAFPGAAGPLPLPEPVPAEPLPADPPRAAPFDIAFTAPAAGAEGLLTGVPLGGGVILLVPGAFPLDPIARAEVAAAARPLLDLLASRRLTDRRDS